MSNAEEQQLWAARLALPVLSTKEIIGLIRYRSSLEDKSEAERKEGPRRFSVFLLSRRLGIEVKTFARKVRGGPASDRIAAYVEAHGNPIDWPPV